MVGVVTHEQRIQALNKAVFGALGAMASAARKSDQVGNRGLEIGDELLEKIQNITGFNTLPVSLDPQDVERWLNV